MHFYIYGLIVAAIALPGCALADTDLICSGELHELSLSPQNQIDRPIDAEVKLHLAETAGLAYLPSQLIETSSFRATKPYASQPLVDVAYADDMITADVHGPLGWRAYFVIDRVTGHIAISGESVFTGTCKKYDPATVAKQF